MLALLWQRNHTTATCCCGTCSSSNNNDHDNTTGGCLRRWRARGRSGQGFTSGPGVGERDGLEDEGEPVVPVRTCEMVFFLVVVSVVFDILAHEFSL